MKGSSGPFSFSLGRSRRPSPQCGVKSVMMGFQNKNLEQMFSFTINMKLWEYFIIRTRPFPQLYDKSPIEVTC